MSTPNLDGLEQKIDDARGILGNKVKDPSAKITGTASTPLYVDSNSLVAQGNVPFPFTTAGIIVSGLTSTTVTSLVLTGSSNTDNADLLMSGQLVGGARVTTFTKTGFIRVNITDSAGVITAGDHYIQIGTLT